MPNFVKFDRSVAKILRFFRTKFRQNRSLHCGDIAYFLEFSRWPPRPSWIFEIAKFYWLLWSSVRRRISVPNFVKIGQLIAKILRFFDFSRWRPPPSCTYIFEIVNFCLLLVSAGPRRITVPNFVKIGRSIAEILHFFSRILKMAAAAILDFLNRDILLVVVVQSLETYQHAKFRQNRSTGCEDINIFRFFKMAAVAILNFRNCELLFADGIWRAQTHHCTKYCQNRSLHCGDIAFFSNL